MANGTAKLVTVDADNGRQLDHYNPHDGIEAIGKLESLESYYKRAKDATGLYDAVERKLGEQRRFVLWWDQQEKASGARGNPGGRGAPIVASQTDDATSLADFGLDRDTVHRWRKRLKDPRKFDGALEAAQERCRRVCEAEKGSTDQKGATGTGENEWYTPPEHLAAAREVIGAFDLDPASSDAAQEHVQATDYFTKETNGLEREWHGRVWLNPPYAQPHIADFASKMVEEYRAGRVSAAVMLTHNYTDTAWFHELARMADAICFTRGRVKFYDSKGNVAAPTQGQAFFYFGPDTEVFAARFRDIGFVVTPFTGECE